jgi:hypothetical protein
MSSAFPKARRTSSMSSDARHQAQGLWLPESGQLQGRHLLLLRRPRFVSVPTLIPEGPKYETTKDE